LDSNGAEDGSVAGCCEHGDEQLWSIQGDKFHDFCGFLSASQEEVCCM
jgi:hypothetical protein